jgi:hypothetical protein
MQGRRHSLTSQERLLETAREMMNNSVIGLRNNTATVEKLRMAASVVHLVHKTHTANCLFIMFSDVAEALHRGNDLLLSEVTKIADEVIALHIEKMPKNIKVEPWEKHVESP